MPADLKIWKDIPSAPKYQASSLGEIRNGKTERLRKFSLHASGYLTVQLQDKKTFQVHRLVAEAFFGSDHRPVDHKDSDKQNNTVSNLHYVTHSENSKNNCPGSTPKQPRPVPAPDTEWRTIPGYEPYQASSCGLIKRPPQMNTKGLPLRMHKSSSGYFMVTLSIGGKTYSRQVHRLVATAFHGLPTSDQIGHHKDHVKTNNAAANLEWVSRSDNAKKFEATLGRTRRGLTHARFNENDVKNIKRRIAAGESLKSINTDYGVPANTLSNIKTGRSWKHVRV